MRRAFNDSGLLESFSDDEKFDKLLGPLVSYMFIRRRSGALFIHPLVQDTICGLLDGTWSDPLDLWDDSSPDELPEVLR